MVPTNASMNILYFGKKRRIKTKCLWRQSFESIVKVLADKSKHCVSRSGVKQVRVQTRQSQTCAICTVVCFESNVGQNGDEGILFQASTFTTIVFRGKISLNPNWILERHLNKTLEESWMWDRFWLNSSNFVFPSSKPLMHLLAGILLSHC